MGNGVKGEYRLRLVLIGYPVDNVEDEDDDNGCGLLKVVLEVLEMLVKGWVDWPIQGGR
jgi:hypothetical protein